MESFAQLEYDLMSRRQWIEAEVTRYLAAQQSAAGLHTGTPTLSAQDDTLAIDSVEGARRIPHALADYAVSGISA